VDLQLGFSRGFTPGFLEGPNHQRLVPARFPKARGVRIGTVSRIDQSSIAVELEAEHDLSIIKPGDGVVTAGKIALRDGTPVEVIGDAKKKAVAKVEVEAAGKKK
jgi:hypothetical protein